MKHYALFSILAAGLLSILPAQAQPDFDNDFHCMQTKLTARMRFRNNEATITTTATSKGEVTKFRQLTRMASINQQDIFEAFGRSPKSRLWVFADSMGGYETWITDSKNENPLEITAWVKITLDIQYPVFDWQQMIKTEEDSEEQTYVAKDTFLQREWRTATVSINISQSDGEALYVDCTGYSLGKNTYNNTPSKDVAAYNASLRITGAGILDLLELLEDEDDPDAAPTEVLNSYTAFVDSAKVTLSSKEVIVY